MKKFHVLFIILILTGCQQAAISIKPIIREPAVAGSWYPGTEAMLSETMNSYFNAVNVTLADGKIKALIVPHAGWQYSGKVATAAFKQLEAKKYDTVILIGGSHRASYSGASLPNATHFRTPLGLIQLSPKIADLLKDKNFLIYNDAHEDEHSLEIELPFLQKTLGSFELVPILIGYSTNYEQLLQIAESLNQIVDDSTLIVVSSDFTHYGSNYGYIPFTENIPENIKKIDSGAVSFILNMDSKGFYDYVETTGATICGKNAIMVLLSLLKDTGIKAAEIAYDTSGRMTNDYRNSVSYEAMVFYGEGITKEDKEYLLTLARHTLDNFVSAGMVPVINEDILDKSLTTTQGCFVTLNKDGNLRGCIGHIIPQVPLYKCVIENAVNAASHDMRFTPVKAEELKDIEVEVSVLSVPTELYFNSSEDLLNKLRPNIDGVVLQYQGRQSTYLPQVWEQLPDTKDFLTQLCLKQGSPAGCWQRQDLKVYTYTATVFAEE